MIGRRTERRLWRSRFRVCGVRHHHAPDREKPGFRERILASVSTGPAQLEEANANYVGGDIAGGRFDLGQLFTRPSRRVFDPYATPNRRIYICSAATPPGAGVHGMGGYNAARSVLRRIG